MNIIKSPWPAPKATELPLGERVAQAIASYGDDVALIDADSNREVTFRELGERITAI